MPHSGRLAPSLLLGAFAFGGAGCLKDGAGLVTDGGVDANGVADGGGEGSDGDGGTDAGEPDGPRGTWVNVTGNLAGMTSECGNLSTVVAKPGEDVLLAGIAQAGIWASADGGATWNPLGRGAASANITNRTSRFVFDPANARAYYESGLYNGNGVYQTSDDGATFQALGDIGNIDLVSVDFQDPDRMTLLAGSHERSQSLWRSSDRGATWVSVGSALPAATNCSYPQVLGPSTYLVGCGGYGGGPTGIYRSEDAGGTWASVSTAGGTGAPLVSSDGTLYWAGASDSGLARSFDSGRTWEAVTGPGVLRTASPIELPDGRIAAVGVRALVVSSDHGATWSEVTSPLPIAPAGLTYSSARKAFYVWHFTCDGASPVPDDGIERYDDDVAGP